MKAHSMIPALVIGFAIMQSGPAFANSNAIRTTPPFTESGGISLCDPANIDYPALEKNVDDHAEEECRKLPGNPDAMRLSGYEYAKPTPSGWGPIGCQPVYAIQVHASYTCGRQ